jgi:hypothetical protein
MTRAPKSMSATDHLSYDPLTLITSAFFNSTPSIQNVGYLLDLLETDWKSPAQLDCALSALCAEDSAGTAEHLFTANMRHISDTILGDTRLTREDVSHILDDVARRLPDYQGEVTVQGFPAWCESVAFPLREWFAMKREHASAVRGGILHITNGCSDLGVDYGTVRELENQAWLKIFLQIDGFLAEGTAKLKNRLFAMGRWQAMAWRSERLRHRERFMTLEDYQQIENGLSKARRVVKSSDEQRIDPDPGDAGKRIALA